MEQFPLAGPSRPRRPTSNNDDLASRIVALQRKNAASSGTSAAGSSGGTRGSRRPPAEGPVSGSNLTVSPVPFEVDKARRAHNPVHALPSRPPSSRTHQDSNHRSKPSADVDEYNRGPAPERASAQRALYDPSRPASAPQAQRVDRSPRLPEPQLEDRRRIRPDAQSRRQESGQAQIPAPARKLFDPSIHDPHHFSPRPTPSSGLIDGEGAAGPSRLLIRRAVNGRTPEEEADRERERRRRREGSERGSIPSRRKESDARSKGSRSSEGSESFKDRERGKGKSDAGVKPILKEIHDGIKKLEQELIDMHRLMSQDPEAGISALLGPVNAYSRRPKSTADDAAAWVDLIAKHKQLAEMHDNFLVTLYDPLVPSSYHQLSVKYNIPSRLWQTGFHLILERLRLAWMSDQPAALDLLTDVVYDAYRFYTELLENQALANFRTAWIEALGDLARYRMAIASHVSEEPVQNSTVSPAKNDDDEPPVNSGASIGAEVAQAWDVEDKETWRTTARDWYTMGVTEKPGEGRLHHHLALLCRDQQGQEGRALYHFVKSLTVTHEFATSRESILPLFDSALQSQRSLPDATAMDLFVRLHGMLFTRIQLDDFPSVMSRFMERLEEDASLDGVSRKATITQVDWMMMASVNIAALLQYGASTGVIRKALAQEGAERRRQQAPIADDDGDGDGEGPTDPDTSQGADQSLAVDFGDGSRATSPAPPPVLVEPTNDEPPPISLTHAVELAFAVFDFVLAHPNRIQGFHHVLNPYITVLMTFLATLFRQPHVGAILAPSVPWYRLRDFVNAANIELVEEKRLATGAPLPEDWIVRGSEWVGRRVYERGFWKGKASSRGSSGMIAQPRIGERFQSEMDVLLANFDSALDISEGVVDEVEGTDLTDGPVAVNQRRWKRVAWATGVLAKHVDGFNVESTGKIQVQGSLDEMLRETEEKRRKEVEEEEKRKEAERKRRWAEDEVDMLQQLEIGSDEGEDDAELAALRERRKQLQSLLNAPTQTAKIKSTKARALQVVPGYTMLIFDTNVLLDSLALFAKLVEGGQWSIVVPLPVVTELDGLSKEAAPLGVNAKVAVTYLESRIRTHSLCLKIQTTKGNYLSDLLIRTEHHASSTSKTSINENTMDDRILDIASFQQEHFVDRSTLLGLPTADLGSTKVLLVSNDRNLRLKASSRGVDTVDEKGLKGIARV